MTLLLQSLPDFTISHAVLRKTPLQAAYGTIYGPNIAPFADFPARLAEEGECCHTTSIAPI